MRQPDDVAARTSAAATATAAGSSSPASNQYTAVRTMKEVPTSRASCRDRVTAASSPRLRFLASPIVLRRAGSQLDLADDEQVEPD